MRRSPPLAPAGPCVWRDERECARRRRPVVLREPERELDERRGNAVDDRARGGDLDAVRRVDSDVDDHAAHAPPTETDAHDRAALDVVCDLVRERTRERAGGHERVDLGQRHRPASVSATSEAQRTATVRNGRLPGAV